MPLAQIDYELKPNIYDNKLRSWDPDGTYQEDPGAPDLSAPYAVGISEITTTTAKVTWQLDETQHTRQRIQLWIEGVSNSWEDYESVMDRNARQFELEGLPSDTEFRARLRSEYED